MGLIDKIKIPLGSSRVRQERKLDPYSQNICRRIYIGTDKFKLECHWVTGNCEDFST